MEKQDGVKKAEVSFEDKSATITIEKGKVRPADLIKAVESAGNYSAEEIK